MASEARLERAVVAWAAGQGIGSLKQTPMGSTGWPDRMFFYMGKVAFIEFKSPTRAAKPERNQGARLATLHRHKFPAEVINDYDTAISFLKTTLLSD